MKKITISKTIFCLLTLLFLLPFCPSSAYSKEKITVTDMAGRKVTLPAEINRIVPLGSAMRFLTYMQAVDKVVGIEAFEHKNKNASGRPYSLAIADKVDKIPAIGEGGPGKLPDFERIIAVKPDVIIAMGLDLSLVQSIEQKTAIPVLVLSYGGRGTLDFKEATEALQILGRLLNMQKRAEYLTSYINQIRLDLNKRTSQLKHRPSVYVGAVSYSGRHGITSTQGNYVPLMWINGSNVADALKKSGHLFVDKEQILKWSPDYIFIDTGGFEMLRDDYKKNPQFYSSLKAVSTGNVFSVLPFNFYHTNIEIALANAYYMGKVLYPKEFKDIDPAKKADEIFKAFVGTTAYEKIKKEFYGFGKVQFSKDTISIK